jgi:hypothetical protein
LTPRPRAAIPVDELLGRGVWEFAPEDETRDETWLLPVSPLPVSSLAGRVAVTTAHLRTGEAVPVSLSNVALANPGRTREFLVASFCLEDANWFHVARYFDPDYGRNGPAALAAALGRSVNDIFPIRYDLSRLAVGDVSVVYGIIPAEPEVRIDRKERMRLLLEPESL